jgi:hypothetical protein
MGMIAVGLETDSVVRSTREPKTCEMSTRRRCSSVIGRREVD